MDILSQGEGPLFGDPSADEARRFFAGKPRGLVDKVTTAAEAVTRLVRDGDYLAVGGFGGARLPTAVVHEIVRQNKQDLGLAGHTATHDFQVLCAGNLTGRGRLLRRVDVSYVLGLEARGLSPQARRVLESGEVACTEWSNYTLALRFKAAAMGLPFLPSRSLLGTDTFQHSAARVIACPFRGRSWPPSRRCTPTSPPSTSTRPTATATAASAGRPWPTWTWRGRRRSSSSPANGSSRATTYAATRRRR
jgi:glutaconate CoA-transferase subunit A